MHRFSLAFFAVFSALLIRIRYWSTYNYFNRLWMLRKILLHILWFHPLRRSWFHSLLCTRVFYVIATLIWCTQSPYYSLSNIWKTRHIVQLGTGHGYLARHNTSAWDERPHCRHDALPSPDNLIWSWIIWVGHTNRWSTVLAVSMKLWPVYICVLYKSYAYACWPQNTA